MPSWNLFFLFSTILCQITSISAHVPDIREVASSPTPIIASVKPTPTPPGSGDNSWRHDKKKQASRVHDFFRLFGWIPYNSTIQESDLPATIRKMQKTLRIPQTGEYDDTLEAFMTKPRCGTIIPFNRTDAAKDLPSGMTDHWPDPWKGGHPGVQPGAPPLGGHTKRYELYGGKWDHMGLSYRFLNYTSDISQDLQESVMRTAFDHWSQYSNITFRRAPQSEDPDIYIKFQNFGPSEYAYATTSMIAIGGLLPSGLINITFNDDWNWADDRLFNYTAIHETGHALGIMHSKVPTAIMWPVYDGIIRDIAADDMGAEHSLYGWKSPRWKSLDKNSKTRDIVAVSSMGAVPSAVDGLYQLRTDGTVLWYSPQGLWMTVDSSPNITQIAGSNGNLFQLRVDGSIYRYTGSANQWTQVGTSDNSVVEIVCASDQIYQRRKNGLVSLYSGSGKTWKSIDQPTNSKAIAISTNRTLYNLQANGDIVRSFWPYDSGWQLIDNNQNTIQIVTANEEFYKLQSDGKTVWLDIKNRVWTVIDSSYPEELYASGDWLYSWHIDGSVLRYTGTPDVWEQIDDNKNSSVIVGDSKGHAWELLRSGEVLELIS